MLNILVVLGLFFGKLLGLITKQEVKDGKRYFLASEKVILVILALILLIVKFNVFSLFIFLGIVLGLILRSVSLFLGLSVFLSNFVSKEFSLLIGSLAFIYLLVYSRDLRWRKLFYESLFFLAAFSLIFVESFINGNLTIFLSISAGGLLAFIGPVAQLGRATVKKS